MSGRLRIVLVDDHAVVRAGYRLLLEHEADIDVVAELESGEEVNRRYQELQPDVVVLDLSMPGIGGLEAIRRIKAKDADARILVFTMFDSLPFVEQALDAGACGYITKNSAPRILVEAVRSIAAGRRYVEDSLEQHLTLRQTTGGGPFAALSQREFQIFCLLAEGSSAGEISSTLSLSIKTVANYQTQIKEKLGLSNRTELVRLAIRQGVIKL